MRYWLHSAHLLVENKKMSKSAGNFYTLRDLLEMGHDPLAIRWVLLSTHYRQPSNFTFDALAAAGRSLQRIRDFRIRLSEVRQPDGIDLQNACDACENLFRQALDDDLNISAALASVFEFIRQVNVQLDQFTVGQAGAERALALLDRLNAVTGVFAPPIAEEAPQEVLERVAARTQARRNKDFALADAIRDELAESGWLIEDTPDGPRVKRAD